MVRVSAPTSTTRPSGSWRITTRLASHARRRAVSAETRAPSSSADWPDALDALGGAGATDTEQPLFGLRRRHAGQRPHLGVRQLPARRARVEPDAPGQPGGARPEPVAPTAARVEVAD